MNSKVLINFIKDKSSFSIFFFINTFLIILFFHLALGDKIEIIYPVTISIFVYAISIIIELVKYYKFNSNLFRSVDNINYDLQPSTYEQKEVSSIIGSLHTVYLNKIATIKASNKSNK
jgi:two-component system, OmpR family, sensor histidine kinase YxdK